MIDLNDEILIDFIAGAEDYYNVIQDAMSSLRQGNVQEGASAMLRPLHTIKGTSGFIAGMEKLKTYTHQVEDILKRLQGEANQPAAPAIEATIRAVDEVFNLLDQVKRGSTVLDDREAQTVLAELRRHLDPAQAGPSSHWFPPRVVTDQTPPPGGQQGEQIEVKMRKGATFITPRTLRLHLAWQCAPLAEAVAKANPEFPVVIDLGAVRTISSTAWGEIWQASQGHQVALIGLGPAVEATYLAWGLDARIKAYPDEGAFWSTAGASILPGAAS